MFAQVLSLDTRSLSLFRVLLGAVTLADLVARAPLRSALYGPERLLPERFLSDGTVFQAFLLAPGEAGVTALFAIAIGLASALLLGVGSRTACIGLWFLVGSLGTANPAVESYGDRLLLLLLLFGAFLPLDTHAALRPARAHRHSARSIFSVASSALVLQIVVMYGVTGLLKTGPAWHAEASAIEWVLQHEYWARPTTAWLLEFPAVLPLLTRCVYAFEIVGPLLLLCPWQFGRVRTLGVAAFWLFHLGLAIFMVLGPFPWVCIAATSALLPGWLWERVGVAPAEREVDTAKTGPLARATAGGLMGAVLAYVLVQNAVVMAGAALPEQASRIGRALGLRQHWSMYAPEPRRQDGWYVFVGEGSGGSRVDLHRGGAPISAIPPSLPWSHADFRLAMLIGQSRHYGDLRRNLAGWLCAQSADMLAVEIRYVEEHPDARGGRGRFEEHRLGRLDCVEARES